MKQSLGAPHGRTRLQDVAKAANVSIATASKVINGRTNVASDTRERVERAVRELGYIKAKSGDDAASGVIEVVFTALDHFWVTDVLQGISIVTEEQEARLEVSADAADTSWVERAIVNQFLGVIAVMPSPDADLTAKLAARRIPCVLVDPWGNPPAPGVLSVQTDFWSGGLIAVRHLVGMGHRRIATITGQTSEMRANAQLDGFGSGLDEAGIPRDDRMVVRAAASCGRGREAAMTLLTMPEGERPTAIVAQTDLIAMGVYQAAWELGLRIPDDLSVVGYDDIRPAQYMTPPLTTVARPMNRMGQMAAQMIFDYRLEDEPVDGRMIAPPVLVERSSVAAPKMI
ncbi:LacI family DNA-binding transcriptional regulator [Bifidobacterium vespertilionis]|uniref:LacI family transcriptional regulator n=1 Tax=Bifidobacterium vespertilionis TaxID=2562524 RepID=A0A5J5DX60_9BIFI|nr:LacI family DNA-binding transcriptional regulator [Bifidobacterium vespertilionis]KAA8821373.1 LacI family transcriptional regulator [Bifidobacterium vespertilionis]KAA8824318.1 LacI family transcriptional regulator [Bifidobacterium vespertilionis]